MENISIILASFIFFGASAALKTPVLIWSPNRPLSDLPQSYTGQTVKDETFSENYLKPLTSDPSHSVLVFLQDKLSVEDFTNHADVYNPSSDGGAFKNVKAAMDNQFSVQLPAVISPKETIEGLSKSFSGNIVRVDKPEDIANMQLEEGKGYLILVTLQPIQDQQEFESFKRNDEAIGKCLHHMNKRNIKYSAIYTAGAPSKVRDEEAHSGRHLLEAVSEETYNGTFFNKDGLKMFLKYVTLAVTPKQSDPSKKATTYTVMFPFDSPDIATTKSENNTITLTLTFTNNGTATLEMFIVSTQQYEFASLGGTFSYTGGPSAEFDVDDLPVDYKIQATRGFCFHCTKLSTAKNYTVKDYNGTNLVDLTLHGFQIEAFNPFNSTDDNKFTDNVWDCVEFFSIAIWMGILTSLLLLTILFFGITMISNITTMDRFDDPKGMAISVTVNE